MKKTRQGLTLLEWVVGFALFAVAVVAMMGVFTMVVRLSAQNREATQAAQLAQELFERIRVESALPDTPMEFRGEVPTSPLLGFPPAPYPKTSIGQRTFTFAVKSEPVAGRDSLYSVTVEVRWGEQHRSRFQTRFFKP